MPQNYVPIFIFIAIVGTLLPITLLVAKLVRPDNPNKTKLMPYECGIDPIDSARGRYTVRYYIIAILFVVFDVETIFLFPWAVKFKAFGLFGLLEMLIFLAILIVGYIWVWRKGALEWVSALRNFRNSAKGFVIDYFWDACFFALAAPNSDAFR
jgi:NADH-quinone oxidoreductase subunit A